VGRSHLVHPAAASLESVTIALGLAVLALAGGGHAAPDRPAAPAPDWTYLKGGPDGGTIWQGQIPNSFVPSDTRLSAVYLPPGYDPARRYPVIYLLHGMRGSPSSFYASLKLATVADELISTGRTLPFIAVMPVAGPVVNPDSGEWAGVWEDFVVSDVVPWVDAHLPTIATPGARALEGLCAGGFGAVDIGLRHPGIFGTLGSWEGYFAPVFYDGPFVGASAPDLLAHDPSHLVQLEAAALQRDGVRFYVSVGGNHGHILRAWSVSFADELHRLGLRHELWLLPPSQRGHFWRATLPSALSYAAAAFG
jgi:enterochelin esterase-like enzyme